MSWSFGVSSTLTWKDCFNKETKVAACTILSCCCYCLNRGNYYSIIVKGNGIQAGDRFIFLHSDPGSALTRVDDARHSLEALDDSQEVFGGLIFSSHHRGKSFLGASCVDTSPFTGKLSGVPIAGISCAREIGRGALLGGQGLGYCFNAHSCVYLAMSYVPPMSQSYWVSGWCLFPPNLLKQALYYGSSTASRCYSGSWMCC